MRLENIVRLLVAAFLLLPVTGHAQETYPNRPITLNWIERKLIPWKRA